MLHYLKIRLLSEEWDFLSSVALSPAFSRISASPKQFLQLQVEWKCLHFASCFYGDSVAWAPSGWGVRIRERIGITLGTPPQAPLVHTHIHTHAQHPVPICCWHGHHTGGHGNCVIWNSFHTKKCVSTSAHVFASAVSMNLRPCKA